MSVNVNAKIKKLSPAQREKVAARAVELIAGEMSQLEMQGGQAHEGAHAEVARDPAGQRLTAGKTKRPAALDAAEDG